MSDINKTIYDRKATTYETKWKNYLEHTHEQFLQRISTNRDDIILDISCGTGLLAEKKYEHNCPFKKLILNDPSEQMLAIARKRLADKENIRFTNFNIEDLAVEKQKYDQVFCLNAFHFYSDQQQVLQKLYALLKPAGRLCLLDWNRSGFFTFVNQLIKWNTTEYIDTKSFAELEYILQEGDFRIYNSDQWNWRYWKFLFIEAGKEKIPCN